MLRSLKTLYTYKGNTRIKNRLEKPLIQHKTWSTTAKIKVAWARILHSLSLCKWKIPALWSPLFVCNIKLISLLYCTMCIFMLIRFLTSDSPQKFWISIFMEKCFTLSQAYTNILALFLKIWTLNVSVTSSFLKRCTMPLIATFFHLLSDEPATIKNISTIVSSAQLPVAHFMGCFYLVGERVGK